MVFSMQMSNPPSRRSSAIVFAASATILAASLFGASNYSKTVNALNQNPHYQASRVFYQAQLHNDSAYYELSATPRKPTDSSGVKPQMQILAQASAINKRLGDEQLAQVPASILTDGANAEKRGWTNDLELVGLMGGLVGSLVSATYFFQKRKF